MNSQEVVYSSDTNIYLKNEKLFRVVIFGVLTSSTELNLNALVFGEIQRVNK